MFTELASNKVTRFLVVVFVVLSVGTAWQVSRIQDDLSNSDSENAALKTVVEETVKDQQLSKQQAALLEEQVKELGARPVVDPDDLSTIRGDQGVPGAPGRAPTTAEIALAVSNYCSGGRCDGLAPTAPQVAAAVALYCNNRGECRGSDGTNGSNGENGIDGSDGSAGVDGKDGAKGDRGETGPPPTDSQMLAAVNTYCADQPGGNCRGAEGAKGEKGSTGDVGPTGPIGPEGPAGPPGSDGSTGATGEAGRGIISIACNPDSQKFIITYTDGTTAPVEDSDCVADVEVLPQS